MAKRNNKNQRNNNNNTEQFNMGESNLKKQQNRQDSNFVEFSQDYNMENSVVNSQAYEQQNQQNQQNQQQKRNKKQNNNNQYY